MYAIWRANYESYISNDNTSIIFYGVSKMPDNSSGAHYAVSVCNYWMLLFNWSRMFYTCAPKLTPCASELTRTTQSWIRVRHPKIRMRNVRSGYVILKS
jgi:hypothetical protein